MPVGLIGLGNLGTAVANLIAGNGHEVLGWEHNDAVVQEINDDRTNSTFLPDVPLHPGLAATGDLSSVARQCEIIFVALPSVFIKPTLSAVREEIADDCLIVNMAKGIDRDRPDVVPDDRQPPP